MPGRGADATGAIMAKRAYGARILNINGKSYAVFVNKLEEVATVLDAFKAATESGELDRAVLLAMKAKTAP